MSDARLRELERCWKQSSSPEDHAALLRERVRTGILTTEKITLASHLRSAGAALVCPPPQVIRSQNDELPMGISQKLAPFGGWARVIESDRKAAVRTAVAVIGWVVPKAVAAEEEAATIPGTAEDSDHLGGWMPIIQIHQPALIGLGGRVVSLVLAAKQLALDWTDTNRVKAISASMRVEERRGGDRFRFQGFSSLSWTTALGRGGLINPPIDGWLEEICYGSVLWRAGQFPTACEEHQSYPVPAGVGHAYTLDPCWKCIFRDVRAVQARVSAEVVPWLLGDGDPLAESVDAEAGPE